MTDTSWLEVDLNGLRRNIQAWRGFLRDSRHGDESPCAKLCAVVKADAYGLGAGEIGRCLDQSGVDMLAVYSPAQADELLEHPITRPILLLMPVRTRPETVRLQNAMFQGQLHLTVDAPDQLLAIHAIGASYGTQVPIHLSLDTGMSRGGLSNDQLLSILRRLPRMRHVRLAGIWTHFAAADCEPAFTEQQFARFMQTIEVNRNRIPRGVLLHAAATHATLSDPRYHLHMTRIGLGMFGHLPGFTPSTGHAPHICGSTRLAAQLEPVIRWRSRLIHVRRYPAGSNVGYNCTTTLKRDSFLGLIPVGYADGLPLSLSGRGVVHVLPRTASQKNGDSVIARPIAAPILGRVNMDQVIVDLTPDQDRTGERASIGGAGGGSAAPLAQVGDLVDIISPDASSPCALPNFARLAGTSCYELLCRISPRVPRLYRSAAPSPAVVAGERLKLAVG